MASKQPSSRIYLDSVARQVGLGRVADWLPFSARPMTAWALVFVFIDVVVLQPYKLVAGYEASVLSNQAWVLIPLFVILAALGTEYLYERYDRALELISIDRRTTNPERFGTLAPTWVTQVLYLLALLYLALTGYKIGLASFLEYGGIAEVVGATIIGPVGYAPVLVEFLTASIGVTIFLPRRIKQSDFTVHFLDPEGLGGLRPIGELVKLAYYLMMIGLVGFLVLTYGPHTLDEVVQTPYPEPGIVTNAVFTVVWVLTIAMLAHALYVLHTFLKREREDELAKLDEDLQDLLASPYDIQALEITDEKEFQRVQTRIEYVNGTKEYPTTFSMWSQILIGVLLPKATQLLLML